MYYFSLHKYTIYTSFCMYSIFTHIYTDTWVYIITTIALNLKLITYTCFPEAFKSLNVNTILLKIIIIIIYRFSNTKVNKILMLRTLAGWLISHWVIILSTYKMSSFVIVQVQRSSKLFSEHFYWNWINCALVLGSWLYVVSAY